MAWVLHPCLARFATAFRASHSKSSAKRHYHASTVVPSKNYCAGLKLSKPMAKPSRTRQLIGWAILIALILLAGRAVRSIIGKPSLENWPLAVSALLWVLFSIYWSVAAKNSSKAARSETRGSRRVHEILLNVGLLLLFIPLPGMTQRFMPMSMLVTAAGLGIQVACGALGIWARKHLGPLER